MFPLVVLTVDSTISPNFNMFGVTMISCALLFDAAIGNVQEKAMREHNASNVEVVFYSYGIGFVYLLIVLVLSGNIISSIRFCATVSSQHTINCSKLNLINFDFFYSFQYIVSTPNIRLCISIQLIRLFRNSICSHFSKRIWSSMTTARKTITIVISFIFFSKPFSIQ